MNTLRTSLIGSQLLKIEVSVITPSKRFENNHPISVLIWLLMSGWVSSTELWHEECHSTREHCTLTVGIKYWAVERSTQDWPFCSSVHTGYPAWSAISAGAECFLPEEHWSKWKAFRGLGNKRKNGDDVQKASHPYSCPHSTASTSVSLYLFLKDNECMQPGGQEGPQG